MKKRIRIVLLMATALVALFFLLPDYTRNALIHQHADIDDYLIFSNDTIYAQNPYTYWKIHPRSSSLVLPEKLSGSILQYSPIALLVARGDTILFEQYYDGHTSDAISNSFSVTKTIVALLAGAALREGAIASLEDPVTNYVPEFTSTPTEGVLTVKHLLEMSSGLDYQEVYTSPFGATTRSYYGSDITQQILELDFAYPPGIRFEYLGGSTQLLSMVIQRATGKTLAEYAQMKLWNTLQAEHNALWSKDRKNGAVKAFCCFSATARDFARIGRLLCQQGVWKGDTVINTDYFNLMTSPSVHIMDVDRQVDFYGYQTWLTQYQGLNVVYARGIRGQYIIAIPERDLVLVRLGHQRSETYRAKHPDDLFLYLQIALLADRTI
jgi:CubicO group peptidase (beta-lactamase class C family)